MNGCHAFRFGIATACCVYSLAGCGRTDPAPESAASAASAAPAAAPAGPGVAPADWPTYNRTLAGDRFSPLAEIDRSNVANLKGVWRARLLCSQGGRDQQNDRDEWRFLHTQLRSGGE